MDKDRAELTARVAFRQKRFWGISDAIWSYAELGLEEHRSSKLLADTLADEGFEVERGVAGMPTAFTATWRNGTGTPVIGFLAEYDALPALSQKSGSAVQEAVVAGAPGHGCGHNTMGAMQALAVTALKDLMVKKGISGTLKYYGCPGEEILVPRPYMIRAGLFKGVDAVIDCHAWDFYKVAHGPEGAAAASFLVTFRGRTAHAGGSPWLGRSAADAVELMHAGTERMREHLPGTHRIQWVTLEGGEAPNVVPDKGTTWYMVRDIDENLEGLVSWVTDCAKAAALMTQTKYEIRFVAAVHQRFSNKALAELVYENMKEVGKPEYLQEEESFARDLQKSVGVPVVGLEYPMRLTSSATEPYRGGSSDVGDVTLVAPTVSMRFPARIPGAYSHHWTVVSGGATSFAHKGITAGAKVAALSAFDLMTRPELLGRIRAEFDELTKARPYKSFLPQDAEPPLGWHAALMEKYRKEMEKFYAEP